MTTAPFKVYVTKDYKMFKKLLGNRYVEEKRVKRLMDSIGKIGYLNSAIIVNERMEVIDGQTRLEALKRLKLPVYYCIHKGAGIEECLMLNIKQQNWTIEDYAKSYAEQGNENYIKLLALKSATGLSVSVAYWIAKNVVAGNGANGIVLGGKMVITDDEYNRAMNNVDFVKVANKNITRGTARRMVLTALNYAYNTDGVDKKRLMRIAENKLCLLKPFATVESILADISDVYNKGLKDNKIAFDAIYKIEKLEKGARN